MIPFVKCDYCAHYKGYIDGVDYCEGYPEGFDSLDKNLKCPEGFEYVPDKERGWMWEKITNGEG